VGAQAENCRRDIASFHEIRCVIRPDGTANRCAAVRPLSPQDPDVRVAAAISATRFQSATWAGTAVESVYLGTHCPR
jgi:hypothetical protein